MTLLRLNCLEMLSSNYKISIFQEKWHTILHIIITTESKNENTNECFGKLMAILTFWVHVNVKLFPFLIIRREGARPGRGGRNAPSPPRWLRPCLCLWLFYMFLNSVRAAVFSIAEPLRSQRYVAFVLSFQTSYPPPSQQATYKSPPAKMQLYSYQSQQSMTTRSFNQPNQVIYCSDFCSHEYE